MGANENSILKKCGEILINIKLKSKKTKTYTFNCIFCDANWDQLKKFSTHLEEKHLQQFTEEFDEKSLIFEPEIKLEEHLEVEKTDILKKILKTKPIEMNEDPLEPIEFVTTPASNLVALDVKVKDETEENCKVQCDDDEYNLNNDEMDYEDCIEDKDNDIKPTKKLKTRATKSRQSKKKNNYSSEDSTDNSNDSDFLIDEELNKYKKALHVKTPKSRVKSNKDKELIKKSKSDTEICSENENELIKALFQAYEKQTYLWDGNEKKRTNDKNCYEKGFETIANEVNEKLNTNITGTSAKNRLNKMRIEYSYELQKQREGEPHQIPWYTEHMHFLQKNIDYVIRSRIRKRLIKRAAKMDESQLLNLIELYKKYEALWQVNNISFGITAKRDEIFNNMIEDLKTNHDIDMTIDNLQDYIKYINRLYSKDKELQLKCELENSEFTPLSQFYKEMTFLNESQGPFKCAICNDIIQKYENYHIHVANHNNTIPFKCPMCEMGFKKFDKYIIHAKRHLGVNSFHCNVCGKGYPFKSELDWHSTSHTGDKPYLCQVCGTGFRARHEYDNHIRRHEKRFRYECHICKHGFNHLHHLNDHVKSHLNIRDNICNVCGKAFTAIKYLKNHKLIHEDTKRYKCKVCGKEFAQGAGLRQHRKQHQPHLTAAEIKRKNEAIPSFPDAFNF